MVSPDGTSTPLEAGLAEDMLRNLADHHPREAEIKFIPQKEPA
jgi:hypothetical protein